MNKLEEIKNIKPKRSLRTDISEEEYIEISLAWLKDEIVFTQIGKGLNLKGSNIYNFLSTGLKLAYRKGLLKTLEQKLN